MESKKRRKRRAYRSKHNRQLKNHFAACENTEIEEFREHVEGSRRMVKKAVSEAAASKEAKRTLCRTLSLSDARTKLADFFNILFRMSTAV